MRTSILEAPSANVVTLRIQATFISYIQIFSLNNDERIPSDIMFRDFQFSPLFSNASTRESGYEVAVIWNLYVQNWIYPQLRPLPSIVLVGQQKMIGKLVIHRPFSRMKLVSILVSSVVVHMYQHLLLVGLHCTAVIVEEQSSPTCLADEGTQVCADRKL